MPFFLVSSWKGFSLICSCTVTAIIACYSFLYYGVWLFNKVYTRSFKVAFVTSDSSKVFPKILSHAERKLMLI